MKEQLTVVKLGGTIIDSDEDLKIFLKHFSKIQGAKILVHGGGKIATTIGNQLGIAPIMIEGRRVTTAETLELVTMVYAGLLNKKIVAQLQSCSCNAFGLCGADGNLIRAKKRSVQPIDFGFVGDPELVDAQLLNTLLSENLTPVIAPITHNGQGQLLNTNADTIAQTIASAMSQNFQVHLVFAFEKKGVLSDINNRESRIEQLSSQDIEAMKLSGTIHNGMLPKLSAGFQALEDGVDRVCVGSALELDKIIANNKLATQLIK